MVAFSLHFNIKPINFNYYLSIKIMNLPIKLINLQVLTNFKNLPKNNK